MTLLLCGISQQSSSLYVTHFSPESNDAQNACIIKQDSKNPITKKQVKICIHAVKKYVISMQKRLKKLRKQYKWLMNHSRNLTNEQRGNLENFKDALTSHEALKALSMIKSLLAHKDSLTEQARDLMTNSYQAQSIANKLASGEAELNDFEKLINHYVALTQQNAH